MALIIEDGSGVPNANSYVSVAEVKAFAESIGQSLPAADEDVEKLAVESFYYVESYRTQFQGKKTNPDPDQQSAQWPRTGVVIDDWAVPSDRIPSELKNAQCQGCIEAYNNGPLMPSQTGAAVTREKIDVLEVQYAAPVASGSQAESPSFPAIDNFLEPLLNSGGGYRVKVIRA